MPSKLSFNYSYTPQRRLQQSEGGEAGKHGQRKGSNLEIIFQRRKGKCKAWVPGSQTTTRKLWLPIPSVKASHCDSIQSSPLCLDLNQTNTDGKKNFVRFQRKGTTGSSKLTRTWLLPILFILQILKFCCISGQWRKVSKQASYAMLLEPWICPLTSGKWA